MFEYRYPQFQKKRILRAEMLDDLRDYPKNFVQLSLEGFGNGIIKGCEITWEKGYITVHRGMIYYNGNVYFLKEPHVLECRAKEQMQYLKVQFLTEVVEIGNISGTTRILLEESKVDRACELELCRFRLQEGARLRDSHEGFEDYSTKYDTVNKIHAPYAVLGGTTLQPDILKQFAIEMMEKRVTDPYDISFAFLLLGNEGVVSRESIRQYLQIKTGHTPSLENEEVYQELLKIVKQQRKTATTAQKETRGNKNILLI